MGTTLFVPLCLTGPCSFRSRAFFLFGESLIMPVCQCDPNVHPHKFRRTMATAAIDKGMPIEQVQRLLGHEKIDTTLHYAMVKQNNVKMSHKKYIG